MRHTLYADTLSRMGKLMGKSDEFSPLMDWTFKGLTMRYNDCKGARSDEKRPCVSELFILRSMGEAVGTFWEEHADGQADLRGKIMAAVSNLIQKDSGDWYTSNQYPYLDVLEFVGDMLRIRDAALTSDILGLVAKTDMSNASSRMGTVRLILTALTLMSDAAAAEGGAGHPHMRVWTVKEEIKVVRQSLTILSKMKVTPVLDPDQADSSDVARARIYVLKAVARVSAAVCKGLGGDDAANEMRSVRSEALSSLSTWMDAREEGSGDASLLEPLAEIAATHLSESASAYKVGTLFLERCTNALDVPPSESLLSSMCAYENVYCRQCQEQKTVGKEGLLFLDALWQCVLQTYVRGLVTNLDTEEVPSSLVDCTRSLFRMLLCTHKYALSQLQDALSSDTDDDSESPYAFPIATSGAENEVCLGVLSNVLCWRTPSMALDGVAQFQGSSGVALLRKLHVCVVGLDEAPEAGVAAARLMGILLDVVDDTGKYSPMLVALATRLLAQLGLSHSSVVLVPIVKALLAKVQTISDTVERRHAPCASTAFNLDVVCAGLHTIVQGLSDHLDSTPEMTMCILQVREIILMTFISLAAGPVCLENRTALLVLLGPLGLVAEKSAAAVAKRRRDDEKWLIVDQGHTRRLWTAILVLRYGLEDGAEAWTPADFSNTVGRIACVTEPLVLSRGGAVVGLTPEDDRFLSTTEGLPSALVSNIYRQFSGRKAMCKMPTASMLAANACMYLEHLRIVRDYQFHKTMSYLSDESILAETKTTAAYVKEVKYLFGEWASEVVRRFESALDDIQCDTLQRNVSRVFRCSVRACLGPSDAVHPLGLSMARTLVQKFPWLRLYSRIIPFLLDALATVERKVEELRNEDAQPLMLKKPFDSNSSCSRDDDDSVDHDLDLLYLDLPNVTHVLEARAQAFIPFLYEWICTARRLAPKLTIGLLQEYFMVGGREASRNKMGTLKESRSASIAAGIADEIIRSDLPTFHLLSPKAAPHADGYPNIISVDVRRAAARDATALLVSTPAEAVDVTLLTAWADFAPPPSLAEKLKRVPNKPSAITLTDLLRERQRLCLLGHAAGEDAVVRHLWTLTTHIRAVRYRDEGITAPALHELHSLVSGSGTLLQQHFTPAVTRAFVECAQWIAAIDPHMRGLLLAATTQVLVQTSTAGQGIFRDPHQQMVVSRGACEDIGLTECPTEQSRRAGFCATPDPSDGGTNHEPHLFLLDFINQHGDLSDDSDLEIIFPCLEALLSHPAALSSHPSAALGKLALVCLAIRAVHASIHARRPIPAQRRRVLRERVYRCALSYFEGPATWREAQHSTRSAVTHFNCLVALLELVRRDQTYWVVDYAKSSSSSGTSPTADTFEEEKDNLLQLRSIPKGISEPEFDATLGFVGRLDVPKLLQMLLLNEMDRVVAWHCDNTGNSTLRIDEYRLDADRVRSCRASYERLLAIPGYLTYMFRTAWRIRPSLALRMRQRLPGLVHDPLCREMVGAFPRSVRDAPDAACLLVEFHSYTSNHAAAGRAIEELGTFAPVSATEAIGILNRCSSTGREKIYYHDDLDCCTPKQDACFGMCSAGKPDCCRPTAVAPACCVPARAEDCCGNKTTGTCRCCWAQPQAPVLRSPHSVPHVIRFIIRSISSLPHETQNFYLPQFIQLLRRDIFGAMREQIVEMSARSVFMSHRITWMLTSESIDDRDDVSPEVVSHHGLCKSIAGEDPLPAVARDLVQRQHDSLNPEERAYSDTQISFWNRVCSISARLASVKDKSRHSEIVFDALKAINVPDGLYVPTEPSCTLVAIDAKSAVPMQSAAKAPFLLHMWVKSTEDQHGRDSRSSSPRCIKPPNATKGVLQRMGSQHRANEAVTRAKELGALAAKAAVGADVQQDAERSGARISPLFEYLGALRKRSPCASMSMGLPSSSSSSSSASSSSSSSSPSSSFAVQALKRAGCRRVACIFKVYDDCRQDCMTLQVVHILRDVFETVGIPLYLNPYTVIPNRTGADMAMGGLIQVIDGAQSRDQIGKGGAKSLFQHFLNRFGLETSSSFRRARFNFARSLAGYAVVCHLLAIKDRHNGNILIDDEGCMCHIDYGFLLGISPGGNLGFETASFKLTPEMLELLGGNKSETWCFFVAMTIRGFLAARQVAEPLLVTVASMADSGLPCFNHHPDTLAHMRARFVPEATDVQAAEYMRNRIFDAADKWTTRYYDGIQKLQNNIYSDTWL